MTLHLATSKKEILSRESDPAKAKQAKLIGNRSTTNRRRKLAYWKQKTAKSVKENSLERLRARTRRRNMPTTPTGEGASGTAEVRVLSVGKTLKIEPFKIPENHLEIGRAWQE